MNTRTLLFATVVFGSATILTGCFGDKETAPMNDPALVDTGDIVSVKYTLTWSDDKVFASNASGTETTALSTRGIDRHIADTVEAGDTNILWGSTILGKKVGDSLSITIDPKTSGEESAYNVHKVQNISRTAFGSSSIPTIGDVYEIAGQRAYISALSGSGDDEVIVLDLNPRQTRDTYTYNVTVTDIINKE